jgi:hypothetical protein
VLSIVHSDLSLLVGKRNHAENENNTNLMLWIVHSERRKAKIRVIFHRDTVVSQSVFRYGEVHRNVEIG